MGGSTQEQAMKLKALDTFHTSELRTVQVGQEFETTGPIGRDLERAGLATVIDAGSDEPEPVVEQEPAEKAEPAPLNKIEPAWLDPWSRLA